MPRDTVERGGKTLNLGRLPSVGIPQENLVSPQAVTEVLGSMVSRQNPVKNCERHQNRRQHHAGDRSC
jgi:hypothetical protein